MRCLALLAISFAIGCGGSVDATPSQPAAAATDARVAKIAADNASLRSLAHQNYVAAKAALARVAALEHEFEHAQRAAVGRYIEAADHDRYIRAIGSIPEADWPTVRPYVESASHGEQLGKDDWLWLNQLLRDASGESPLWMAAATDWTGTPVDMQPPQERLAAARRYLATEDPDERAAAQFDAHAELIDEADVIQPASAFVP